AYALTAGRLCLKDQPCGHRRPEQDLPPPAAALQSGHARGDVRREVLMRSVFCLAGFLFLPAALPAQVRPGEETTDALRDRAKQVLARIDGEYSLAGLKEAVEVRRDRWGVAHIYARNAPALFFAQGFVAAQDRLFQLDLWRRQAAGEMAEILGQDAVEADRFARLLKYRGDMQAEWASYSPDTKAIATAFTQGIN